MKVEDTFMRRGIAITLAGFVGWFATACLVRAGLYNTAEPRPVLSRKFEEFKETLIPLRQIGSVEAHSELNRRYELVATLAARAASPTLTVEQRLDLNAYLVRALKAREGVTVLAPAQFQERDNFLVLCNLATAEFLDGQPRRARDYQSDALQLWPREWSGLSADRQQWLVNLGWKEADFRWYREVETYQLRLIRLRAREAAGPAGRLPENVDALFDEDGKAAGPLRFVADSGRYEAGKLAAAERAKVPPKAIEIVEQLLVWMPNDTRLYWLLGELFNAAGDVSAAKKIFNEVEIKWNPPASKTGGWDSRAGKKSPAAVGFQKVTLPQRFKEHLEVLRAQPEAPLTITDPAATPAPAPVAKTEPSVGPLVEWKSLAVGFGVGLAVAFFGYWQIREIRRRRR
jgi:hypothetical protein